MKKAKGPIERPAVSRNTVPCKDEQDVYRTLFEGGIDKKRRCALPFAYLRRENRDFDGISVAFSEDRAKAIAPTKCQGVAKHIVLAIRSITLEGGASADLEVMEDSPTHGHIRGLPWPPSHPQIGIAHYLAGQLAKQARVVWMREEEDDMTVKE